MKAPLILTAAAAMSAALSIAGAASAGGAPSSECPTAQMRPNARAAGETMPSKVTDTELNTLALGGEIQGLDNRRLRLRRLVIQPRRRALAQPHRPPGAADDRVRRGHRIPQQLRGRHRPQGRRSDGGEEGRQPLWKNTGKVPVVILAADIKNDGQPASTPT